MRFNSPDKLSPFDKGGINSYAYCGGDPINFIDPNGHFFHSFRKLLVSTFGGALNKPPLSVTVDYTKSALDGVSKYQNIKRVTNGFYIADEPLVSGGKSLIINGHGISGGHLLSKGRILNPKRFMKKIEKLGVNMNDYNDVHLMICHSAEGADTSLAQLINSKFSLPVTAYEGSVAAFYAPSSIVKKESSKIPWFYRSSLTVQEAKFIKSKQMDIRNDGSIFKTSDGRTHTLNYRPVRFK